MYQTELSLHGLIGSPSVSEGEGPSCLNRKFRSFLRGKQQRQTRNHAPDLRRKRGSHDERGEEY